MKEDEEMEEIKPDIGEDIKSEPMEVNVVDIEKFTTAEEEFDQKYRENGQSFLQHVPCYKLQSHAGQDNFTIPVCRECRRAKETCHKEANNVYCRFYEFRRLYYEKSGKLIVDGFPNPYLHPKQMDINIWEPDDKTMPTVGTMDIQVCRQILLHVGDQFCYLWKQEAEALKLHENPHNIKAWKKAVQGIREICDVCDTTLFNYHWTCDKCGFSVCLDCFKDRKEERNMSNIPYKSGRTERGRDDYHWLLCVTENNYTASKHKLKELMLTQIIPGDALNVLGRKLHAFRALWQVPQSCGCFLSKMEQNIKSSYPSVIATIKKLIDESLLKPQTEHEICERKRIDDTFAETIELAKQFSFDNKEEKGDDNLSFYDWSKPKEKLKDPISSAFDQFKHISIYREGLAGLRRFIPPLTKMLVQSNNMVTNVLHEWLCEGKLLHLYEPTNLKNHILFQEVWKCGQPVLISNVNNSLNLDLWQPESFCRDFGDKPNDLINCLNGNLVPNQPMRHFWEGFQCISKRLLDSNGRPMLLKLKDWPPGDDFAEILPKRYEDLMKGLPLPEYTLRTGTMNLASCLPKMFVPPDLGPKMYNAYGSALHPDKGTTNLHLDISDAVNIMVYVGIPKDADGNTQVMASKNAIDKGGVDFITRARVLYQDNIPGALWHIFEARDADKIRDLLNRVTLEKGYRLEPDHDAIHDQNWYLDYELRQRLFRDYGVQGYPIVQCLGDAIFIPAGAPHQVQNLHNCIKVAEDFVSPENISHCYHLTHEFRRLSHSHTNHEDKLQIKNIIFHSIKDACTILERILAKTYKKKHPSYRAYLQFLYKYKKEQKTLHIYKRIKKKYLKLRKVKKINKIPKKLERKKRTDNYNKTNYNKPRAKKRKLPRKSNVKRRYAVRKKLKL